MWRYPKYDPIFCGRYVQTVRLLCEGARLKAGTWNGKRLCKRHLGKQDKKLLSRMPGRGMFESTDSSLLFARPHSAHRRLTADA